VLSLNSLAAVSAASMVVVRDRAPLPGAMGAAS
jgi:hypothetical protein